MLTEDSLRDAVEISRLVVNHKQQNNGQVTNANYNQLIRPEIDDYSRNHNNTPNLLFKEQLDEINDNDSISSKGYAFFGRTVNSHVWASLFIEGGHPFDNPQLYILANHAGIKYGLDYGSNIIDNNSVFVQRVLNDIDIKNDILNILRGNTGIKLYDIDNGSPALPPNGSEIQINTIQDLENRWNFKSHLIGSIESQNINPATGQIIESNLNLLFPLYLKICFPNQAGQANPNNIGVQANPNNNQNPEELEIPAEENIPINPNNQNNNIDITPLGDLTFEFKNIFLKGVPGTGKSRLVDSIITNHLQISQLPENILRVNIHSASTNSDLMRGIGITTLGGQIQYNEKRGLILNKISKAIKHPFQAFAIILEEVQENSLNELIGDLIYLIEPEKRVNIRNLIRTNQIGTAFQTEEELIERIAELPNTNYVTVPYLVSTETKYRKMILPDNIYIFCTSNYRNDKKVIEDNLLRRFEVIEVYPKYDITIIPNADVARFLRELNESIIQKFQMLEIHPDRFMIGHAIWISVNDINSFYRSLLKVVVEFKDIKEIEFSDFNAVLENVNFWPFGINRQTLTFTTYSQLISFLQEITYQSFING